MNFSPANICLSRRKINLCVCFSKINNATKKRRQRQKRDDSRSIERPDRVNRRRTSFSAKRVQNDREPIEESHKDVSERGRAQYKSNEDNYRAERRKSTSSQENGSRMEEQKTDNEANINHDRIDCDGIESRNSNDDDNDKRSEKGSVEHDASGKAIRRMEL